MPRNGFSERGRNHPPTDTEVGHPVAPIPRLGAFAKAREPRHSVFAKAGEPRRSVFAKAGEPRHSVFAKAGFTLIEMLVAVTVLAVMTLLLARIISQSNTVISDGSRQATQNSNARMALDFLAREFSQAGADERLLFKRDASAMTPYGNSEWTSHDLRFATFRNVPEPEGFPSPRNENREAVLVAYYLKDNYGALGYYSLMRAEQRVPSTGYGPGLLNSGGDAAELIRYVVEFRAVCHTTNSVEPIGSTQVPYLPTYMDVYLAVLSENDAKRAKTMSGTEQRSFIVRMAKRYHTRCWSLNRTAYIGGR